MVFGRRNMRDDEDDKPLNEKMIADHRNEKLIDRTIKIEQGILSPKLRVKKLPRMPKEDYKYAKGGCKKRSS